MKRIIAAIMLVMFIISGSSFAEEEIFTFRDGVSWGMSNNDVVNIEGTKKYSSYGSDYYGTNNFMSIEYANVKAAGEDATLSYNFLNDALVSIIVLFNDNANTDSVVNALTTKYGESQEADIDRFISDVAVSYPGREAVYSLFASMSELKVWESSSTYIVFLKDMGQLFYFGEKEIETQSSVNHENVINTDGI